MPILKKTTRDNDADNIVSQRATTPLSPLIVMMIQPQACTRFGTFGLSETNLPGGVCGGAYRVA